MISLDENPNNPNNIKVQNYIVLEKCGRKYFKELAGDNIDNIFDKNLINIYLEAFTEKTINNVQLVYDDITEISVLKCKKNKINKLPNKLEKITVKSSFCTKFILSPINAITMTHITLVKTNLNTFPDISQCTKLVSLRIMDSALSTFSISYKLPTTLTELSLAGNVLTNDNFNYSALTVNHIKKISLSDNALDVSELPALLIQKSNIRRQNPDKTPSIIEINNINEMNINNIVNNERNINNILNNMNHNANHNVNHNVNRHAKIFNSTQTVHLTSVNKSVIESINVINMYIEKYELNQNPKYYFNYNSNLYTLLDWIKNMLFTTTKNNNDDILSWIYKYGINYDNDIRFHPTKHGITGLKYEDLFLKIWKVMNHLIDNNEFEKDSILERLATEIIDSRGHCFTGRFNRLVNSLCGILDGIYVGISTTEEIQIEMGQIIEKLNNNKSYTFKDAYCDACETLRSSPDKSSWMSALMDLAPEPTTILINDQIYLLDWDDIVTIPENKQNVEEININDINDIYDIDNNNKIGIYDKENKNEPITWIMLK